MLWLLADYDRLSARAAELLSDSSNEVLLSAAVVWEVSIKRSLGTLEAPDDLAALLLGAGAVSLAVSVEHAERVPALIWHHRDPFDRLLVAQATIEGAVLFPPTTRCAPTASPWSGSPEAGQGGW